MKLSLSRFARPVLALGVIFTGFSQALADGQANIIGNYEKDYSYAKSYGNLYAGGKVTLNAEGAGRLLFASGNVLTEVTADISAKKRVKLLGMDLDVAQIDADALGQNKSFDISSSNFVSNISSNGRLKVTPRVKIGGLTILSSTITRSFNAGYSPSVPDINLDHSYSINVVSDQIPFTIWGIPVVVGYSIGGAADLDLCFDAKAENLVNVRAEAEGLGRAYGFAIAWAGVGIPGFTVSLDAELHFMKIEARPKFAMTWGSPEGTINVKRTAVDLFLKACLRIGAYRPCTTLFNYSKGQYSWTRNLT